MAIAKSCARCGGKLLAQHADGLCVRCMLASGLEPSLNPSRSANAFAGLQEVHATPRNNSPSRDASGIIRRLADYELMKEIGRGGTGIVFRARQLSLNRWVAVKMLLHGELADEGFVWRFKTEAEAVAQLDHPHIVPIYEVGENDGQYYFSMKLIDTGSLHQKIAQAQGELSQKEAAQLLATIAHAVHYAHQRGVIHRDLKPQNILLDAQGQPYLTDFGIAKLLGRESDLTRSEAVMGSPSYMAPEQAAGHTRDVTTAADVYSLGTILYALLTGRAPFQAETPLETLRQVMDQEPVPPSVLRPNVASDLETICLKCLEKEAQRRYPSAEALASDLERWLGGEPIAARPASIWVHAHKWIRRKRALAALSAATLLLLLSVTAGFPIAAYRINRERRHAEENLYFADMHGAETAMEDADLHRARELLLAHWKNRNEYHLRDFEWSLLLERCRGDDLFALRGHSNSLKAVRFSPDSRALASHSGDNVLKIWDPATRTETLSISNILSMGCFSGDSQRFIYGTVDQSVQSRELRASHVRSFPNAGEFVTLLEDGRTAVITATNFIAKFLDMENGSERIVLPGKGGMNLFGPEFGAAVVVTPDGKRLAISNGVSRGIALWNLETGQVVIRALDQRLAPITFMELSPDGKTLASGAFDGWVRFWDTGTGAERLPALHAHPEPVFSLAWSSNGTTFATSSVDQSVKHWDFATRRELDSFVGHEAGIWAVAYSPDGNRLASGSQDGTIRLWNPQRKPVVRSISGLARISPGQALGPPLAWSRDSMSIASGCTDGTVKVWDAVRLETLHTFQNGFRALNFSTDRRALVMLATNGAVLYCDAETQKTLRIGPIAPQGLWRSFSISPNRLNVALTTFPADIHLWEIATGRVQSLAGTSRAPFAPAFSPDSNTLICGGEDGLIDIWELPRTQAVRSFRAHSARITSMAVTPDGALIASGSTDNMIKLWDRKTGAPRGILSGHKRAVWALSFSPDGKTLASGGGDCTVRLWNMPLLRESAIIRGFAVKSAAIAGEIRSLSFSPSGNSLAAVTEDGVLRVFRGIIADEPSATAENVTFPKDPPWH